MSISGLSSLLIGKKYEIFWASHKNENLFNAELFIVTFEVILIKDFSFSLIKFTHTTSDHNIITVDVSI